LSNREASTTVASAPTSPNIAAVVQVLVTKAKERFNRGVLQQSRDDLETALDALEIAFALLPEPELLLNMAQVERRLERCGSARSLYERYLRTNASAQGRTVAEHNLAALAGCSDATAGEAPLESWQLVELPSAARLGVELPVLGWETLRDAHRGDETPSASGEASVMDVAPWFLVGAGSVSAILAGAFWVRSRAAHAELEATDSPTRAVALLERGEAAQQTAGILGGVAVGLEVAALGLFLLRGDSGEAIESPVTSTLDRLSLTARAGGADAAFCWKF
jgi:hypothetical protein